MIKKIYDITVCKLFEQRMLVVWVDWNGGTAELNPDSLGCGKFGC